MPGRPPDPEHFAAALTKMQVDGRAVWVVRLSRPYVGLAAGTIVGTSSYLDVSVLDARLELGATAYAPTVWSTKINPDTKLVLLACAFETLGVGRVQLKTDVRNVRSQEAIGRLGARYEGTLRRYQRRADGSVRDTVLFSITAEEWPTVREGLCARVMEPER
jgi:RimJ/RimL family protein N-acetyltransferase